jgi:hypothetical protein
LFLVSRTCSQHRGVGRIEVGIVTDHAHQIVAFHPAQRAVAFGGSPVDSFQIRHDEAPRGHQPDASNKETLQEPGCSAYSGTCGGAARYGSNVTKEPGDGAQKEKKIKAEGKIEEKIGTP